MAKTGGWSFRNTMGLVALCLVLGGWAGGWARPSSAMGGERGRWGRRAPAIQAERLDFKTEAASNPGDWARYERTVVGMGITRRSWIVTETLANDGANITSRASMITEGKDEAQSTEFTSAIGGTIESTLFSDVRIPAEARIRNHPHTRENLVVAGRQLECIVLAATVTHQGVQTDAKVWYSADAPFLGMVKKETVSKAARGKQAWMSVSYRTELQDWGDAWRPMEQ